MADWKITQAITNGIEQGIANAGEGIAEFFRNLIFDMFDIILDAGATFTIIMMVWTGVKLMHMTNKEKRDESANLLVSMGGLYFILRMMSVILS